MAQYIEKSALVAEIERLKECNRKICGGDFDFLKKAYPEHYYSTEIYNDILSFLNTLEVKEVDLEEELKNLIGNVGQCDRKLAKHFFELGLKVSSSITATDVGMAAQIIINLKRVEKDYHINLIKEIEWLRKMVKKGGDE